MDLHIKPYNTNLYKKSVINMRIWLYNIVSIHIKKLEEYKAYKREFKSFLIDRVFYSIEEFLCYWSDAKQLGLNKIIIIFNVVYVQSVKITNCSMDTCIKSVQIVI